MVEYCSDKESPGWSSKVCSWQRIVCEYQCHYLAILCLSTSFWDHISHINRVHHPSSGPSNFMVITSSMRSPTTKYPGCIIVEELRRRCMRRAVVQKLGTRKPVIYHDLPILQFQSFQTRNPEIASFSIFEQVVAVSMLHGIGKATTGNSWPSTFSNLLLLVTCGSAWPMAERAPPEGPGGKKEAMPNKWFTNETWNVITPTQHKMIGTTSSPGMHWPSISQRGFNLLIFRCMRECVRVYKLCLTRLIDLKQSTAALRTTFSPLPTHDNGCQEKSACWTSFGPDVHTCMSYPECRPSKRLQQHHQQQQPHRQQQEQQRQRQQQQHILGPNEHAAACISFSCRLFASRKEDKWGQKTGSKAPQELWIFTLGMSHPWKLWIHRKTNPWLGRWA